MSVLSLMDSDFERNILKEDFMSCPYMKEGYFAVSAASGAIHVPTIEEMERCCFR